MQTRRAFVSSLTRAGLAAPVFKSTALASVLRAQEIAGAQAPPSLAEDEAYWGEIQRAFDTDRTLIFAVPLKPKEKKTLYVYAAQDALSMPGFPPKTAWDSRHAYRSFENNLIAYRMETGPGANTMGFGIDAFGKTKAGKGLRLQEAYEHGHDSYHKLAFWGVDILKVGYGPAIGGIYVISGDASGGTADMGRPQRTLRQSFTVDHPRDEVWAFF